MSIIATSKRIIKRGDTPTFKFTITDKDGAAVDLTNITSITFAAKQRLSDANADAIFSLPCTVDAPATDGKCRVTLSTTDTDNVGTFRAEVQIIFTSAAVLTAGQFDLVIEQDVIR